ncbi:MAG: hypothetical protein ABSC25_20680 [Roseiarcus sp.]|jgi:hypothetical protein
MSTILIIIILILIFGGGGGYYAHGRYGTAGLGGVLGGIVTLAQYRRFLAVLARRRETQAIDFAHAGRGVATAIDK